VLRIRPPVRLAAGSICGFRAAKSPGRERIAFPPGGL
jgi:hypothetical protein